MDQEKFNEVQPLLLAAPPASELLISLETEMQFGVDVTVQGFEGPSGP